MSETKTKEKILLAILPFWAPLIPPMGISCLKSFLKQHDYSVKTEDANTHDEFKQVYNNYFSLLQEYVPGNKRGNLYNIGNDVLCKNMMAHLNYKDEKEYRELVKILVARTFFCTLNNHQVLRLTELITRFFNLFEAYFVRLLDRESPTILGLSVYATTLPASLFAFKLVKERYPRIKTVMGGGIFTGDLDLASPNYEFFLENTPYIDKIIVGEGEKLFLKYLQGGLPESKRVYTLQDINNETLDLHTTLVPDFSDLKLDFYPHLAAYTSRGCPFDCTFCAEKVLWGRYRKKGAELIVKELKTLSEKYRYQLFLMSDSLLNPIISELAHECLKSGVSLYWDGYLRAGSSVCDTKNTLLWRRGGFYRARLGVESGSQNILQAMGKRINPEQIKESILSLAYAGIKTTTYWVIGYPGETEEDFQQTLHLIEELKDEIYEADCNPFQYHLTGQVNSDQWAKKYKSNPLYPEKSRDMLMLQTWILETEPSREQMFQRLNRFVEHCDKLGIPNPYTLHHIYEADERWKKLHKNAVPSILDIQQDKDGQQPFINENKDIKCLAFAKAIKADEGDWGF